MRPQRARTNVVIALGVLLAAATPIAARAKTASPPLRWEPGEGVFLPGNLWLAGSATLALQVPEANPVVAEIDEVTLLGRWEPTTRFALFTELRLEEAVLVDEARGPTIDDAHALIERLYAEAVVVPHLTARIGKFFTPFGIWNMTHRAPLTWTPEAPAAVDAIFPIHTTGLSLLYQRTWRGWSFDATVYGPAQDALSVNGRPEDEGWLAGTRVAAGRPIGDAFASVGVNAAGLRPYRASAWTTATGLDLDVVVGSHQVTSELTFQEPPVGRTVRGLYLQDVVAMRPVLPCVPELYAILRFEALRPEEGRTAVGGLVGLFWRPRPWFVVKGSYLFANRRIDRLQPGLGLAVSVLF